MFSSEFTCKKCGYRSEHLLMVCPECGRSIAGENDPASIPSSHLTSTGMYLAPVDPVQSKRNNIKTIQIFKIFCGVFALCVFFLIVPFWILPSAKGPDAYGYYPLPRGRNQSAPSKVTERALQNGLIAIILGSAALAAGFFYLRKKQEKMESDLMAEEHKL